MVAMRVLFSTTAGSGHFGPLVPFALACREAGHEVKVAAPASFTESVAGAGLEHAPFADVPPEVLGPLFGRLPTMPREEANEVVIADVFGRLGAQAALPGVTHTIATWKPDLVVREFCEFGSLAAAEQAGVPHVEVAIGLSDGFASAMPTLASPLTELDGIAGLVKGTTSRALASAPVLTCVPAGFDGNGDGDGDGDDGGRTGLDSGAPGRLWRFREVSCATTRSSLPPSWGDPDLPLVYVTFGSVAAGLPPFAGVYRAALEALAGAPVRVLMTTGSGCDLSSIGPVPSNARVEQWWPQIDVMAQAAAVVGHGGFGTTMTSLANGVPQVVVPLFAFDQFLNAGRIAATGTGVCLEGGPDAIADLASSVARVIDEPEYGIRARAMAAEMDALPPVASSVAVLEQLATR